MGISGLYKVLEDVSWTIDLRNLSKLHSDKDEKKVRVAIDGNVWIAKACHTFAVSMAVDSHQLSRYQTMLQASSNNNNNNDSKEEEDGLDKKKIQDYVYECSQWVCDQIQRLCLYEGMDIIVVFDGKTPPLKQQCSNQRKEKRQQAADALLTTENVETRIQLAKRSGGNETYPLIVGCLLELLESHSIPVLVAPYEADAQLMYLSQNGYVDVILTEDSDLYLTCPLIFTKYESHSGTVQLIRQIDLGACTTSNLLDMSPLQSILIMIAAGCDYCSSLPGIGIRTAIKVIQSAFLLTTNSQTNHVILLPQIFQELYHHSSTTTNKKDHDEYELQFMKAIILLRHAIVFCPIQKQCIMMNHPNENDPDHFLLCQHPPYQEFFQNSNNHTLSDIIGTPIHDNDKAISIATGKCNPKTNEPYLTLNNNNDTSMEEDSPLSPLDEFNSQPDHTNNTTTNLSDIESPEAEKSPPLLSSPERKRKKIETSVLRQE